MVTVVVQKYDEKSVRWRDALPNSEGASLILCKGSPIAMPYHLLAAVCKYRGSKAVCFRYLNDYNSLVKSLARVLSESLSLVICFLLNVRVLWICHNVDQETVAYYPRISEFRRRLFKLMSSKIYVTDELLIPHARRLLGVPDAKLDYVTFGETIETGQKQLEKAGPVVEELSKWYEALKIEDPEVQVGLWIGTYADKKLSGLRRMYEMAASSNSTKIGFVIVGNVMEQLSRSDKVAYEGIIRNSRIYVINRNVPLPNTVWPRFCDFVWKPMDDYSIGFTVYKALSVGLPTLVENGTFASEFLNYYRIGYGTSAGDHEVARINKFLRDWAAQGKIEKAKFFESHTWQSFSKLVDFK